MGPKSIHTATSDPHSSLPDKLVLVKAEETDSDYGTLEDGSISPMDSDSNGDLESKEIPEMVSTECQTGNDSVALEAKTIVRDLVNLAYPKDPTQPRPKHQSSHTKTVLRVVNEILDKYGKVYKSMVKTCKISDDEKSEAALKVMCDELFEGGMVTWGRILALYALCFEIARHCYEQKESRLKTILICDYIGYYIGEKTAKWIKQDGGWSELEAVFPEKDLVEQRVWKGLLMTGLGLGVLATVIKIVR